MYFLIVISLTLLFSAFFSGMEIAFVSANKLRIELDKKQRIYPSNILNIFSNNPSQYIATMLIGNNIALVVYGIVMAKVLEPTIELFITQDVIILLIQTIISTLIILLISEFLPKTVFRINPNNTLKFFAVPVYFFYLVFFPIARFSTILSRFIIKIVLRVKIKDESTATFSKIDLDHLVNETKLEDDNSQELDHDVKIFQNALDFSSIKLRECILPRTEIQSVSIDDSVETLQKKFIETGHSKIIVYEDSIDNIIGYAPSVKLFENPTSIKSMIRKLPIVPETMPANKLLSLFIQNKKSMALVVDEFGGTSGIVTMEDILEEIIGDIQDEHDRDDLINVKISENEYKFSGRFEIDDANELYNLNLPESDEYETLAGLILKHHGSIPKVNDTVIIDNLHFRILKASSTKIELIHLKIE